MKKIDASPEQLAKAIFDSADRKAWIQRGLSKGEPLKVIAGAPDKPLVIGEIEIPCYVLEDEMRVLSQRGVFKGVNFTRGGPHNKSESLKGGAQIPRFAGQIWLSSFIPKYLEVALNSPIIFRGITGGNAYGYPATILVDLCNAIIDAHNGGATSQRQAPIVDRAMALIQGLASVGIIALVDEATGYQEVRARRALATILEKYIATELQPWTKTFPYEFYGEIFRLKGWPSPDGVKRPSVIGHYTNNIVYSRIAPGVLDELRKLNPTQSDGTRKTHHHRWFTTDFGHPKLREHLAGVIALMRVAPSWDWFKRNIAKAYPKLNEQIPLQFEDD